MASVLRPGMARREFLTAGVALAAMGNVHASSYPAKPLKLIVPWPAGGGGDQVGRAVAAYLAKQWRQPVFVENVSGAGGTIGAQQLVRASADGYTLFLATSSTNSAGPHLYKGLRFDPIADFTPVVSAAVIPSLLVVGPKSPYQTAEQLIAAARAKPGQLNFASGGVGQSGHLAGAMFKSLLGLDITHVPYKGAAPALADVMGGQADFVFDTGAYAHALSGSVRPLAVAASARHPIMPNVPTLEELGVKGMVMTTWYGIAGPAGLPKEMVEKVNATVNQGLASGELSKPIEGIGGQPSGGSVVDFNAFWRSELKRYAGIVKLAGATLE